MAGMVVATTFWPGLGRCQRPICRRVCACTAQPGWKGRGPPPLPPNIGRYPARLHVRVAQGRVGRCCTSKPAAQGEEKKASGLGTCVVTRPD
ncbi:hypothetical protein F5X68DRAFT_199549 [Plectosphaerella plurivora]|uniref:Uncharacterized protein n=1 Tax=Plectosphaerella plurivora TaxID=936078 RepID=A0A9P9AFJ0_9PEZI|nr:hypothetical protein F5X68DRAFT_199549 [Plectosphaerella plurivora]